MAFSCPFAGNEPLAPLSVDSKFKVAPRRWHFRRRGERIVRNHKMPNSLFNCGLSTPIQRAEGRYVKQRCHKTMMNASSNVSGLVIALLFRPGCHVQSSFPLPSTITMTLNAISISITIPSGQFHCISKRSHLSM